MALISWVGRCLALPALAICVLVGSAPADVIGVSTPIMVDTTTGEAATIASPRWKGYIDATNPDRMWIMHGDGSSWATNIVFTDNGGDTWNNTGMQAIENGWHGNPARRTS